MKRARHRGEDGREGGSPGWWIMYIVAIMNDLAVLTCLDALSPTPLCYAIPCCTMPYYAVQCHPPSSTPHARHVLDLGVARAGGRGGPWWCGCVVLWCCVVLCCVVFWKQEQADSTTWKHEDLHLPIHSRINIHCSVNGFIREIAFLHSSLSILLMKRCCMYVPVHGVLSLHAVELLTNESHTLHPFISPPSSPLHLLTYIHSESSLYTRNRSKSRARFSSSSSSAEKKPV